MKVVHFSRSYLARTQFDTGLVSALPIALLADAHVAGSHTEHCAAILIVHDLGSKVRRREGASAGEVQRGRGVGVREVQSASGERNEMARRWCSRDGGS